MNESSFIYLPGLDAACQCGRTGPRGLVKLSINGENQEVPAGITVEGLLKHFQLDPQRVAVEVDRKVVQRDRWGQQTLQEGSAVEIVQFVGGG